MCCGSSVHVGTSWAVGARAYAAFRIGGGGGGRVEFCFVIDLSITDCLF